MQATNAFAPASPTLAANLRSWFERLVELDFTRPLAFAVLALVYFGSRLYWLNLGYGTDPDAWRVALTADQLWNEHSYWPSRLPGYPLHEVVTAAAIRWGWVWTNFSTVVISVVGVYLFAWLAKKLELPNRGALVLGFAFAPLLWINSVMTIDYMWALTFIMAAYLALIYRAPSLAGLLLGIAAGFRFTSLIMLFPFWLLLWRSDRRGELRPLTWMAFIVTVLAFTPVFTTYGLNMLNFYDQPVPLQEFIKRLGKDGLGIIGGLAFLWALAASLPRLRRFPGDLRDDAHTLTWTAAIVVIFLSYLRLPHEIAYLIPVFPFGFFLMSRYFSRTVLLVALAVIVIAGFVDVTSPDDTGGINASTFTSARIGKGMLLSDIETLHNQADFAHELRALTLTNSEFREPAVVMTGFIYPEFAMLYKDQLKIGTLEIDHTAISQLSDKGVAHDEANRIDYVWLLDWDDYKRYQTDGWNFYYTADAARSSYVVYGYRPGYFNAEELPLSRENPSLGAGTATTDR